MAAGQFSQIAQSEIDPSGQWDQWNPVLQVLNPPLHWEGRVAKPEFLEL